MKIAFDIETDGLNPTIIYCIAAKVIGQDVTEFWTPETVKFFPAWLVEIDADTLIGHNIVGFDLPVMKKLLGFDWWGDIEDTLIMSRLDNPSREKGQSLASWGIRFNYPKGEFSDWTHYSQEMKEYCIRDVEILDKLYRLMSSKNMSETALSLEHEIAEITHQQTLNGWKFDIRKASSLLALLKEQMFIAEDEVRKVFTPLSVWMPLKQLKQTHKKDGGKTINYINQLAKGAYWRVGEDIKDWNGEWGYYAYPEFNLGSRQQIAKYLQHFGWKPKAFTDKGNVIVDEKVLKTVNIPEAKLILDYLTLTKRIAMVKSWVEAIDDKTGRVHGKVNSCGAVTGRMTHSKPNCAQVPASKYDKGGNVLWGFDGGYGADCRDLWTVPDGYSLVGIDASGLELRMLAHYMDDYHYTQELLNGDIHTANQKSAGLKTRDQAKTFIYAFLYGAGDVKIGQVAGGGAKRGRTLKKNFLDNTPALRELRKNVQHKCKQGWVRGLDGRKLHIRSEHSALNTLLQSAGAVIMKKALVLLDEYAKKYKIDYKFVLNVHDEFQCEVREDQADFFGGLAVGSIVQAGKSFNLNCPLDGEYKVGETWQQTH